MKACLEALITGHLTRHPLSARRAGGQAIFAARLPCCGSAERVRAALAQALMPDKGAWGAFRQLALSKEGRGQSWRKGGA